MATSKKTLIVRNMTVQHNYRNVLKLLQRLNEYHI